MSEIYVQHQMHLVSQVSYYVQLMERAEGIEPPLSVWKTEVIPLYDARINLENPLMNLLKLQKVKDVILEL